MRWKTINVEAKYTDLSIKDVARYKQVMIRPLNLGFKVYLVRV